MIAKIFDLMGAVFVYTCVATIIAQGAGAAILWSRGVLSTDKVPKYAAAVYGFDLSRMNGESADGQSQASLSDREVAFAARLNANPTVMNRRDAIKREGDRIHALTQHIKMERQRHLQVKQSFEDLLQKLETEAGDEALDQLRQTLESVKPGLAKDLLLGILDDDVAENDNPMDDVVTVITSMAADKRKKLFAQFKADEEREVLHELLIKIGNVAER